jgi:hypothetical protein
MSGTSPRYPACAIASFLLYFDVNNALFQYNILLMLLETGRMRSIAQKNIGNALTHPFFSFQIAKAINGAGK